MLLGSSKLWQAVKQVGWCVNHFKKFSGTLYDQVKHVASFKDLKSTGITATTRSDSSCRLTSPWSSPGCMETCQKWKTPYRTTPPKAPNRVVTFTQNCGSPSLHDFTTPAARGVILRPAQTTQPAPTLPSHLSHNPPKPSNPPKSHPKPSQTLPSHQNEPPKPPNRTKSPQTLPPASQGCFRGPLPPAPCSSELDPPPASSDPFFWGWTPKNGGETRGRQKMEPSRPWVDSVSILFNHRYFQLQGLGGFLERRMPGKNGEATPSTLDKSHGFPWEMVYETLNQEPCISHQTKKDT